MRMFFNIVTGIFKKRNLNFKNFSLNGRGIRSFDKTKALFHWLSKENSILSFCKKRRVPQKLKIFGSRSRGAIFLHSLFGAQQGSCDSFKGEI